MEAGHWNRSEVSFLAEDRLLPGFDEGPPTGFPWDDFGIPGLFIAQHISQEDYLFITQTSICALVAQTSHQFR